MNNLPDILTKLKCSSFHEGKLTLQKKKLRCKMVGFLYIDSHVIWFISIISSLSSNKYFTNLRLFKIV